MYLYALCHTHTVHTGDVLMHDIGDVLMHDIGDVLMHDIGVGTEGHSYR